MRKIILYILFSSLFVFPIVSDARAEGNASETLKKASIASPYYREINNIKNLYSGINNPIKISYNPVKNVVHAYTHYDFSNGRYRRVDKPRKSGILDVGMFGSTKIKKLDLSGTLTYQNISQYDQAWDNTLYLHPDNPFILCDSIPGKTNIEQFKMFAQGAYRFNERITAGVKIKYQTGTKSDQNDPRPKVNSMRLNINSGVELNLLRNHSFGLNAGVEWYNSRISHTLLNHMDLFVYFLMKGQGDALKRTNSDNPSYPREYKGEKYFIGTHWKCDISNNVANVAEISTQFLEEKADDGGTAYSYKGGDFELLKFKFYDRLIIGATSSFVSNLDLHAAYTFGYGNWYAQKAVTDTEHGNISSYEVLKKTKIHENACLDVSLGYKLSHILSKRAELKPDFDFSGRIGFLNSSKTHYVDRSYVQEYSHLKINLDVAKYFYSGYWSFKTELGGRYNMLLGDRKYRPAVNMIEKEYARPMFEYNSSAHYGGHIDGSANIRLRLNGRTVFFGLSASVSHIRYASDSKFSPLYKKTGMTLGFLGINITL